MRQPRLHYEGAYYHILARGNRRQSVFWDTGDYVRYLWHLGRIFKKHGQRILAYCLMPNHVHFLVQQTTEVPISRAMQGLQSAYSLFFNRKHHCVGHVFQGRYKCILIDADQYLVQLVRYIHLNPFRADLEKKVGEYPWTSHQQYVGRDKDPGVPVSKRTVLSMISKTGSNGIAAYKKFISEGLEEGHRADLYELRSGRVLGDEAFEGAAFQQAGKNRFRGDRRKPTIDEIWMAILIRENLSSEPVGWVRARLRAETAFWCTSRTVIKEKTLADYFGVDLSTINKAVKRQYRVWDDDPCRLRACESWWKQLEKKIQEIQV